MINYDDLKNKSCDEIDNVKVEKEKELQVLRRYSAQIELESKKLGKQIAEIRCKKSEIDIQLTKAKHSTDDLKSTIGILNSMFWDKRRENGL